MQNSQKFLQDYKENHVENAKEGYVCVHACMCAYVRACMLMTQLIRCLPCKHEDLNLILITYGLHDTFL